MTEIEFELVVDGSTHSYDENLDELFKYARTLEDAKHIEIYKITRTYELMIESAQT